MTGVLLEDFDAPDNAVILIRDPEGELDNDQVREDFIAMLHARFPESFVVILGAITLEQATLDDFEHLLKALAEHREASGQ